MKNSDIEEVQKQLEQTCNDPNLVVITCSGFNLSNCTGCDAYKDHIAKGKEVICPKGTKPCNLI